MRVISTLTLFAALCLMSSCSSHESADLLDTIVEDNAVLKRINPADYQFTEGPANNRMGHLFFVDTRQSLIIKHDWKRNAFDIWAKDNGPWRVPHQADIITIYE